MDNRIEARVSMLASGAGFGIVVAVIVGCSAIQRHEASNRPLQLADHDPSFEDEDFGDDPPGIVQPQRIRDHSTRPIAGAAIHTAKINQSNPPQRPPLPPQFLSPVEIQAEIVSLANDKVVQSKTIIRTADRIHIRPTHNPATTEWLFIQNPVDPYQINGFKIDHRYRIILEYDDSTLRRDGIAHGWSQVANMGVDPAQLQRLRKTNQQRSFASIQFHRYQTTTETKGSAPSQISELWWNEELALPMQWDLESQGKTVRLKLVDLDRVSSIDHKQLLDPHQRFPKYMIMDAIDWLEQLHDHSKHSGQSPANDHPPLSIQFRPESSTVKF